MIIDYLVGELDPEEWHKADSISDIRGWVDNLRNKLVAEVVCRMAFPFLSYRKIHCEEIKLNPNSLDYPYEMEQEVLEELKKEPEVCDLQLRSLEIGEDDITLHFEDRDTEITTENLFDLYHTGKAYMRKGIRDYRIYVIGRKRDL